MVRWLGFLGVGVALAALLYRRRHDLRRRATVAFWVAAVGYVLILGVRLVQRPPDEEHLETTAIVLGGFVLIWLALWLAVRARGRA